MTRTEKIYNWIKSNGQLRTKVIDVQKEFRLDPRHVRDSFDKIAAAPEKYPNVKKVTIKGKQKVKSLGLTNLKRNHAQVAIKNLELV